MSDRLKMLWTCWLLPAGLGIAAAGIFTSLRPGNLPFANLATAQEEEQAQVSQRADEMKHELPADQPEILKLAALSGRTAEARRELAAALAAGADEDKLVSWLAPILVSDPGYLKQFLKDAPAEGRMHLLATTFNALAALQRDAPWNVLKSSPDVLAMIQASGGASFLPRHLQMAMSSPLAVQVLFDPAMGFTDAEVAKCAMTSASWPTPEMATRTLEEWRGGRWAEADEVSDDCLRKIWQSLRRQDPAALEQFAKSLPPELTERAKEFETYATLMERPGPLTGDPGVEDLGLLNGEEILGVSTTRLEAGQPIPLATLAALPQEQRGPAMNRYVEYLYNENRDAVPDCLAQLDTLPLEPAEKDQLLKQAAQNQWAQCHDGPTALEWLSRMSEDDGRRILWRRITGEFAQSDPQAALDYAEKMPPGPDRDGLTEAAKANQP